MGGVEWDGVVHSREKIKGFASGHTAMICCFLNRIQPSHAGGASTQAGHVWCGIGFGAGVGLGWVGWDGGMGWVEWNGMGWGRCRSLVWGLPRVPAAPRVVSASAGIDRLGGGGGDGQQLDTDCGRGEWALVSICTGLAL